MNVLSEIRSFNAGRDPERLALKYRAMRAGPFAFLRGTCHLFYAQLPRGGLFKEAPKVWVCGDLHLENFGSYKGDNRLTYFDVNDVDESALAPASWDLVRFLTSVQVGAEMLSVSDAEARQLCRRFLDAYAAALAAGKAYWLERDTSSGLVRTLLDDLRDRKRDDFIDGRTVLKGKKRSIKVDGKKALPASTEQKKRVIDFMGKFAEGAPDPSFFKVLDVARRVAGTGSLGVDRFVILVEGKGAQGGNYLLDLKQSLPSSLLARLKTVQPPWPSEAERIVAVQRRLQAVPMAFLHPVRLEGVPYVLRGLQPAEDRVELAQAEGDMDHLEPLIATLGKVVAWSQLRSAGRDGSAIADELMAFGSKKKWKEELLSAAHDCSKRVRQDAATFDAAWVDGAIA